MREILGTKQTEIKKIIDSKKGELPMETWASFADWASKAFLGGVCVYGVNVLTQMKNSIDSLNDKVARLIERTDWHSRELEKLDHRISKIEDKDKD